MVVAGIPHPRWDLLDEYLESDKETLQLIRGKDGDGGGEVGDQGPTDRDLGSSNPVPDSSVDRG